MKRNRSLYDIIYKWIQARPFCECATKRENDSIYKAYCGRIAETIVNEMEE